MCSGMSVIITRIVFFFFNEISHILILLIRMNIYFFSIHEYITVQLALLIEVTLRSFYQVTDCIVIDVVDPVVDAIVNVIICLIKFTVVFRHLCKKRF